MNTIGTMGIPGAPGVSGTTRIAAILLAFSLAGCDQPTGPAPADAPTSPPEVTLFAHGPGHSAGSVLVERAWAGDVQWELVKPRPPGIGTRNASTPEQEVAPGLETARVRLYQIAPVAADDPLSPPFHIPGVIAIAGRDHVLRPPPGNGGSFTGVGQTVPVLHPAWNPGPPFDPAACDAAAAAVAATPAAIADRIAWEWSDPTPHPCGRAAVMIGALLDGDACVKPLTTAGRVGAAAAEGLVQLSFPPEPPWPFALRPATAPGSGRVQVESPACVDPGERLPAG